MHEHHFKLESQRAHTWNVVLGLIIGLGGIPLVFWGLGSLDGGNDLSRWGETWWPVGLLFLLGGTAGAIYVKFFYHSNLTLTVQPNLGLQLLIRDPDGSEMNANGTWKWYAYHTRHYAKYGMYRKEQYLVLYHKDRPYVAFRKNYGVIGDPPPVFGLMPGELPVNADVYRAKEIDKILDIVAVSPGAVEIGI